MDRLTAALGIDWALVAKGRDQNAGWEILGVPDALRREFFRRTEGGIDPGVDERKEALIASYRQQHGREPSDRVAIRLRHRATLETRPAKAARSLAELTAEWRARAGEVLGQDATAWTRTVAGSFSRGGVLRADDLTPTLLDDLAAEVLRVIERRRIVWGRWNLWAEAAVQTTGVRFASAIDREVVLDAIVGRAEDASSRLTLVYDRLVPEALRLPDSSPASHRWPRCSNPRRRSSMLRADYSCRPTRAGHARPSPRSTGTRCGHSPTAPASVTIRPSPCGESLAPAGRSTCSSAPLVQARRRRSVRCARCGKGTSAAIR